MGISILDNFDYRAGKPNFTRDLFATVEEMVAFPEMYLPSVFECNVVDTGERYRYNVNNDVDPVTGKWRLVTGGTGGSVDGITVPTKTSDLTNDSGFITSIPSEYITETELETKGYLTEHQDISNLALKSEIPDVSSFITSDDLPTVPTKVSDLANDKNYISSIPSEYVTETELTAKKYLTSIPEEYITETELNAKGYLTSHQDISGLQTKTDDSLTTTDKAVIGAINEVNSNLLDTVGFSTDYKNIILNRKSGLNPYTIPISAIINNASLAELKDIDSTDVGDGKILVYDGVTNKHKYVDSLITDEFVKMDSTTDAKYLSDLIDKSTVVNDNGVLKVKKLDGQEVTITEINYLKGLTMNVMDLVNAFSNGGVKVLNTPLNTASELDTMDRTSFTDGISYIVYVLADETHSNAKTTYLCTKTSTTFFGNADSQRNFTTNPIDLANEVTGKLGKSNIDVDNLWTLLTINDTYKTLTTNNEIFGTHGAKAMYDELATDIGGKANATDLTTHTGDANIHVTTTDKAKWDKVTDKLDAVDFNTHKNNTDIHITSAERTKWDKVDEKVDKTDIVDNLTSTDTDKPLSANQGKILNDTKLNKTDANKLNCVTIDNVSLKEYILTNCTETEKTYHFIAKTTCTDLPKASNFYITVETPGMYTYKVTAKELNDSNGSYVCTYRTISSSWSAWEKVLLNGDIIDNLTSTDTDKPLSAYQGKVLKDKLDLINPDDDEVVKKTDIATTIDLSLTDEQVASALLIKTELDKKASKIYLGRYVFESGSDSKLLYIGKIYSIGNQQAFTSIEVRGGRVDGNFGHGYIHINITGHVVANLEHPMSNITFFVTKEGNEARLYCNMDTYCTLVVDVANGSKCEVIGKFVDSSLGTISWNNAWRELATTVADVGVTTITPVNSAITGTIEYTVKNGICYVSMKNLMSTISSTGLLISTTMPKPSVDCNCSVASLSSSGNIAMIYIDKNTAKLNGDFYVSNAKGRCSFSYPVAE